MVALPFRLIFGLIRRRKIYSKALVKRVVIVGFDGLDPELCQKYLAEGMLPNFGRLKKTGCFKKLNTTFPALSPVAWSTFATGVNPGRHKIYDFLMRNRQTYLPELSSAKVGEPKRVLTIGKYSIPLGKPEVRLLRKSKSFWKILGENGVFSHIIRVPITFPPEKFGGAMLSAMCTPDLRGTELDDLQSLLLISLGSTSTKDLPIQFVEALADVLQTSNIVWVGGLNRAAWNLGQQLHLSYRWLPTQRILPISVFVITQGGTGSTYQALMFGVAVAVWPSHDNQKILGQVLEELGSGVLLGKRPGEKLAFIGARLESMRCASRDIAKSLEGVSGPENAAAYILSML